MKLFSLLALLPILCASAIPLHVQFISHGKTFNEADRTITWGPWHESETEEFRFRTGDRYLGRAVWEHYLGFEQHRSSSKAIKLSMIRLGGQDIGEEAVLSPGFRYAIFKILNGAMTTHEGVWSWIAQEVTAIPRSFLTISSRKEVIYLKSIASYKISPGEATTHRASNRNAF
jgi:hypothetical protein